MIIIATVGRSGSSMMMEYLKQLGFNVGQLRWVHALDAGNENGAATAINARLRNDILRAKKMSDLEVRSLCKGIGLDAWKDPMLLVHPEMIRYWWKSRKDIHVMYLRRDPEKIVKSIYRHPYFNTPAYRTDAGMIRDHEEMFLETLEELKIPHQIFDFPDFLNQRKQIDQFIRDAGFKEKVSAFSPVLWKRIVNPQKVHV